MPMPISTSVPERWEDAGSVPGTYPYVNSRYLERQKITYVAMLQADSYCSKAIRDKLSDRIHLIETRATASKSTGNLVNQNCASKTSMR